MGGAQLKTKRNGHLPFHNVIDCWSKYSDLKLLKFTEYTLKFRDLMSTSISAGIGDLPCFTTF